jgi:hypothetical protein
MDPFIQLINYLSEGWKSFDHHQFLGFRPTYDGCVKSLEYLGKNYIACHFFYCSTNYMVNDIDYTMKPYILMLMGNDDLSYGKRFKTSKEAIEFFNVHCNEITKHIIDICLSYN